LLQDYWLLDTAHASEVGRSRALGSGAVEYLIKPFSEEAKMENGLTPEIRRRPDVRAWSVKFGFSKNDCVRVITEHPAEGFLFDSTYLDIQRSHGQSIDAQRRANRGTESNAFTKW
jgi:CheY-like chemotaxis protein